MGVGCEGGLKDESQMSYLFACESSARVSPIRKVNESFGFG